MRLSLVLALAGLLGLSACGDTVGEQALIGAGAGALGASVIGGDPTLGAVGGAAANTLFCQQNPGAC